MDREEAIEYLKRKDQIAPKEKFNKDAEKKIKEVMKEGKIYGDPHCELTY